MEQILSILANWIAENLLAFFAFIISVLSLVFSSIDFFRRNPNIKFFQLGTEKTSIAIEPIRTSNELPDKYQLLKYRVLSDVVITNGSSLPISIIDFTLNDKLLFNSYSDPGILYSFKGIQGKVLPEHEALFGQNVTETTQSFPIGDSFLTPILTIPPYTSLRGYLFFKYNNKDDVNLGKNTLKVQTSRKTFIFDLIIDEEFYKK